MPKNKAVLEYKAKNNKAILKKPNISGMTGELIQSYTVVQSLGGIKLSVPLITFSSAGTETQWGESGGVF